MGHINAHRLAVGLAALAVLFLVWVNLAVGIVGEPDDPANLLYLAVPAIGLAGACIARFQPSGMSRALLTTAYAQVLVAMITAVAGLGAPVTPLRAYLVLNGMLISLWAGSAWLFRKAARSGHPDTK